VSTADYDTIASAIAGRFLAAQVTPPAGLANIRVSTANPPGNITVTPAVVVSINDGEFETGNTTRKGAQSWYVRFYFDQTSDLERTEPSLRKWLTVLRDQLKASVQLAGIVDRAVLQSFKVGLLAYGGVEYTGIELVVHTATSEGWVATA
jgi:hypothetical protein